jgi:hypothetical protein
MQMMFRQVVAFIIISGVLAACTKTDDHLRDMVTKHSDILDPSSAMFRNITLSHFNGWCGEINVKNRMGGYSGWKPFHISEDINGDVSVYVTDEKLFNGDKELNKIICPGERTAPTWIIPSIVTWLKSLA